MKFYFKGTEMKEIMFQSNNMSTEPLPTHVAIQENQISVDFTWMFYTSSCMALS